MAKKKAAPRARSKAVAKSDEWTPAKERALYLNLAREELKLLQDRIQRTGSGLDVLRAVSVCAKRDIVMPEWLVYEFLNRWRAITHYRASSWDDDKAFGKPLQKGKHLSTLRTALFKPLHVYNDVRALHDNAGRSINKQLFAEVAKKHGLNTTKTEQFYSAEKKRREKWRDRTIGIQKQSRKKS